MIIKSTLVIALIVTSYITFTLVAVNVGFVQNFIYIWLRSWLIAFILAVPSLLYVAPVIRKKFKS
ncbi:DUF2798 domain-containing protein [Flavobacterium soyangense]|uniref:DUF2798 domain-containing protein n=1 Tax=Flavobacterium soyangense TaxID=2023265 RepID=A0A930Y1I8_9FLAO|nr:DUF2798 domain-containing protein [Flavobacterium soyangense]